MADWQAEGYALVPGSAEGRVLFSDMPISFWGGIDPETGTVIDISHPLNGRSIAGCVLAIPSGRGSCTGSSVMMQLIANHCAPAAMVFSRREEILSLGSIVADEIFGLSIPMLALEPADFEALRRLESVRISGSRIAALHPEADLAPLPEAENKAPSRIKLSAEDEAMLAGKRSRAHAAAMRIILKMADILEAPDLIPVTKAHIDGCIYTGPASLRFAELLAEWGGTVAVPTTLNAISVDQRRWREQGTDPAIAVPASALADAYLKMGAKPSFTCAPYLLDNPPEEGEDVVWAESNAVVYANSVLGARTMKYPDYLDICIALTGRAPRAGCHLPENRRAKLHIRVPHFETVDDSFFPLLGYHCGYLAPAEIPVISGIAHLQPSKDDLKAFGAAFATSSGAPMFHLLGITPEAKTLEEATSGIPVPEMTFTTADLRHSFSRLNSAAEEQVDLVSLGNPHFSIAEFRKLAQLTKGRTIHPATAMVITCGRATQAAVIAEGLERALVAFGATIVTDACWCTVVEPVLPPGARVIMTNSGKFAHYGPGLTGRRMRFGTLSACVEAAVSGVAAHRAPAWLETA